MVEYMDIRLYVLSFFVHSEKNGVLYLLFYIPSLKFNAASYNLYHELISGYHEIAAIYFIHKERQWKIYYNYFPYKLNATHGNVCKSPISHFMTHVRHMNINES